MRTYRLVIFDFDGTLADSAEWFRSVIGQVARRYGLPQVSDAELERLRGLDNRAIIRHLGVPAWKMPLIANHMRELVARDAHRIGLFPGAGDLLRRLDEGGVQVAVVSSNAEANIRRILGPENAGRVRHYGCGASLFGKAAKFRAVLKAAGVPASAALAVGDEVRDIEAAASAGIVFGAVAWGYAAPELLQSRGATLLFRSFDEIAQALA